MGDVNAQKDLTEDYALTIRCYAVAVQIDKTDAQLWRRLGALAADALRGEART